jgi:hypothetical protein
MFVDVYGRDVKARKGVAVIGGERVYRAAAGAHRAGVDAGGGGRTADSKNKWKNPESVVKITSIREFATKTPESCLEKRFPYQTTQNLNASTLRRNINIWQI